MHNPRGSNDRLNEQSATRNNNNRLFDSQNNARGGYNVGDRTATPFTTTTPRAYVGVSPSLSDFTHEFDPSQKSQSSQYSLAYIEGSHLQVEWTNQHGCGGSEASDPQKLNCDIILQFACETGGDDGELNPTVIRGVESLRDGATTGTVTPATTYTSPVTPSYLVSDYDQFGRHESKNLYYECTQRSRNLRLFTADQQLQGTSAIYTRQNANGQRFGLECPEERDYFPYWNPSPWKDIAVLTDHVLENCDASGYYRGASQNNHIVHRCIPSVSAAVGSAQYKAGWAAITYADCASAQGTWANYTHNLPPPLCMQADWTRVNHLGNGRSGDTLSFNWTLPTLSALTSQGVNLVGGLTTYARCVLRIRYNISTDDFDPYQTDFTSNGASNSPITTNMALDIGAPLGLPLTLQLNTAQLARTFQDRSHTFFIAPRPPALAGRNVLNLSVRGKRCNIVECYPAVEYDWVPARLNVSQSADVVHVQWTGSDTHNNGQNEGDGQAGDTGQGAEGTDRNNLIPLISMGGNYPVAYDETPDNLVSRAVCWTLNGTVYGGYAEAGFGGSMTPADVDCALLLWSSGYYLGRQDVVNAQPAATATAQSDLVNMNNAPPSLIGGVILDWSMSGLTQATTYPYLCTRNNAFSNRAQKGVITVLP